MLDGLCRTRRLVALDKLKPMPRIEQRADGKLVGRTTLNYRSRSLDVLLKLWVSECHAREAA
jgi:hypothetical protein